MRKWDALTKSSADVVLCWIVRPVSWTLSDDVHFSDPCYRVRRAYRRRWGASGRSRVGSRLGLFQVWGKWGCGYVVGLSAFEGGEVIFRDGSSTHPSLWPWLGAGVDLGKYLGDIRRDPRVPLSLESLPPRGGRSSGVWSTGRSTTHACNARTQRTH